MVQYQSKGPSLDRTFAALADPIRRQVLERLGEGTATVSELAAPAGISLTGMKKHLRVLEEAGLVRSEKVGRSRRCELGPMRLDDARTWIDDYRQMVEQRLDRLEAMLDRERGGSR
jgi:DNA-binding transcriptional ArsR family regulator